MGTTKHTANAQDMKRMHQDIVFGLKHQHKVKSTTDTKWHTIGKTSLTYWINYEYGRGGCNWCRKRHKKVPKRVSSRVPKKVCDDGATYGGSVPKQASGGGVSVRSDAPEKNVKPKNSDAINFRR